MSTTRQMSDTPLPEFDPAQIVELDVRELLRAGGEPKAQIIAAADALRLEQVLHVRSTFRPEPLLTLMHRRGFHFHSAEFAESDWSTWFWRANPAERSDRGSTGSAINREGAEDLRLLPPPEPLLRILERIDVETAAFEVLLPFFPQPLVEVLHDGAWSVVLVSEASDGVRVRLIPGGA